MSFIAGTPVVWQSTNNVERFFYGRVISVHPGMLFGTGYAIVQDRNFRQPVHVRLSRLSQLSNKNIDTSLRPLLIS